MINAFEIEQKGMTFDHDFCFSFSFSSSLFFRREEKMEKNNQNRTQKPCLSARSAFDNTELVKKKSPKLNKRKGYKRSTR